ncbi:glutaredoxin family protein [Azospira restricta]|uniref:Glutaredoxin family protein n=1 Tax=Azospira restricta TaxID=404405 RepID=A0A974Y3C9_9RHOO|nr:glutaredoxin family protein [Azospira restricta]QRJ63843.1 glutaredoxin family protein [Azospira restricta]
MKTMLTVAVAALLLPLAVQAQTTYRWVDPATGRTVFSDQPPPAGARKATRQNAAEAGDERQPSYAARAAAEKFPVVLYTSPDCTDHCAKARDLLNGRGVPFAEKMVQSGMPELEDLKKLTGGEPFVPVVVVGKQHVKGFEAAGWNNLLDLAGYPKAAPFGSKPANPLAQ